MELFNTQETWNSLVDREDLKWKKGDPLNVLVGIANINTTLMKYQGYEDPTDADNIGTFPFLYFETTKPIMVWDYALQQDVEFIPRKRGYVLYYDDMETFRKYRRMILPENQVIPGIQSITEDHIDICIEYHVNETPDMRDRDGCFLEEFQDMEDHWMHLRIPIQDLESLRIEIRYCEYEGDIIDEEDEDNG